MAIKGKQGALAGASDPSRPGWEDRLLETVRNKERSKRSAQGGHLRVAVSYPPKVLAMLHQCCIDRNISTTAYIRRATMAFLAYDLGLSFTEVASLAPRAYPWAGEQPPRAEWQGQTLDDGSGMGDWGIIGLDNGQTRHDHG